MRAGALAILLAAALCSCGPKLPKGIDADKLGDAVGNAVGDPATCVILAEANTGKVLWRSARGTVCKVERQACTRPGTKSVEALAQEAAKGVALTTGCESVSWAAGPTPRKDIVYAAVMYGERALPGIEIARRLDIAFSNAGLEP